MKKLLSIILVFTFIISSATVVFADETPLKAVKTSSEILVNGENVQFDAYNINDNNYFKLRDIAKALNGSESQFEVTWDGSKDAINLITRDKYTVVGGELQPNNSDKLVVNNTTSKIYVDGVLVNMQAYNINGNNFFKLRDLGKFIKFNVDWDGAKNRVLIDTEPKIGEPIIATGEQPYTFSQTKLDYPYNIFIEGKGYMNFGTAKPFMENGSLYLPIRHFNYLRGKFDYTWEPETNSVILSVDYTEKSAYGGKTAGEVLEPLVQYNNGYKNLWSKDGNIGYINREEFILNVGDSIRTHIEYTKMGDWGIEFLKSGGCYVTQTPGTVYWGLDSGGLDGKGYRGYNGGVLGTSVSEYDTEYKVILRNGEPYLEKQALTNVLALIMLTDKKNETFYYGSMDYLDKMLNEVVLPNLEMDEDSYEKTMEDLFKDIPVFTPPKN